MNNHTEDATPVALYARVSSDRQDVDLSVAARLRALRDYADKDGHIVAREYIDEAESGRITSRPFPREFKAGRSANSVAPLVALSNPGVDSCLAAGEIHPWRLNYHIWAAQFTTRSRGKSRKRAKNVR